MNRIRLRNDAVPSFAMFEALADSELRQLVDEQARDAMGDDDSEDATPRNRRNFLGRDDEENERAFVRSVERGRRPKRERQGRPGNDAEGYWKNGVFILT